jgi:hypothetical protein
MSPSLRRPFGMLLVGGSIAITGAVRAQEPPVALPPTPVEPGVVLELAASPDGDVLGVVPQIHTFSATLATDGGMILETPMIFAQPFGGDDPASMLEMGNVQKELELIDEQKERLREAQRKMHDGMQKHFAEQRELHTRRIRDRQDSEPASGRSVGGSSGGASRGEAGNQETRVRQPTKEQIAEQQEQFKKSQERLKAIRDDLAKEVEDILLPHQKKRLDEIALRMKMRRWGTSGSLLNTELTKKLDITDAQKERIQRKAEEVQKELDEKIAKLREEARQDILAELSPDQRTKLKGLLGAEFDENQQPLPPPKVRRPRSATVEKKPEAGEPKAEDKGASEAPERGS